MAKAKISDNKLIRAFFKKYYGGYVLLFAAVAVFEIAILIFRLLSPGFAGKNNSAHVIIDCIIIAMCFACEAILLAKLKGKDISSFGIIIMYAFCALFIACATAKSYLDLQCGYSSAFFVTAIMIIAGMFVINPYIYGVMVCVAALVLIIAGETGGFRLFVENPVHVLYFIMFIIVSILVCYRHYSLAVKELSDVEKLEALSETDRLTQLGNRRAFDKATDEVANSGKLFSMAIIDVDDYKIINDNYGHDFGDECLKIIARELKKEFASGAYRYGGDEFVVLYDGESGELIKKLKNVNAELGRQKNCLLRLSGGVYSAKSEDVSDIFKKVDDALYYAKSNKKGGFVEYGQLLKGGGVLTDAVGE